MDRTPDEESICRERRSHLPSLSKLDFSSDDDINTSCLPKRNSLLAGTDETSDDTTDFEGDVDDVDISFPSRAAEQAEHLVRRVLEEAEQAEQLVWKVWEEAWKVCHFSSLPRWLQDNDFLHRGHRPPLPSFSACFRSIFRIHTETGNIWTHLLGCIAFIGVAIYFLSHPSNEIGWQGKMVFATFFISAIVCLGMSFTFHTVNCHSEKMGKLFSKLDYCGIAVLIIGSFVPWLYYGFYCQYQLKVFYFCLVFVLGTSAIIVSLWDKFSEPRFRWLRAGVFMGFGLSGAIPSVHYLIVNGWFEAVYSASFGWLCLMGSLYILGALLYALRLPERFFPGKCDIWFHSHQIFHVLVIAAAFVHYHGISEMAMFRLTVGDCSANTLDQTVVD
ncbi:adiponectin receptor protein-like [Centruroides sculpturatus]|uniref:adiponectin receptor protein-like n=2 Tax=Centruroides sculpturatus TaxID=218467 RepID=UPI000C6E06FF|nr:adiponectin receptor protein-like [Centruroides sculpturatus]XP_023219202.1 adiponectin receptor protein-like [Centruroides sculpturatus]XP_023219208.1 adiponectin receptor protein-like [Centruroides sculpturatus]XP_023219212.1 adiponectin receptor protein-like [Centruroides sculpturatus]